MVRGTIQVCNGFKTGWSNLYIGRGGKGKSGSVLANPFPLDHFDSREECVAIYRDWLWDQLKTETPVKREIRLLAKQYLQGAHLKLDCFCAPQACHGDVIKNCVIWYAENCIEFYTGVGSRKVVQEAADDIYKLASDLDKADFILRSGGAEGSDTCFELGSFNALYSFRTKSFLTKVGQFYYDQKYWREAEKIAASVHPVWDKLEPYVKMLHTRNVFQVLGENLNKPSSILYCWTPDGADGSKIKTTSKTGGTATAINIAVLNNVPVVNLNNA